MVKRALRIASIMAESVTDGAGVRAVVFFQGCPHGCPGCHNPQTWAFDGGEATDTQAVMAQMRLTPLLSGVTFSGGEPFAQAEAAAELAAQVKARGLTLWVYTGYTWEALMALGERQPGAGRLLELADVIVDGPYRKDLRSLALPFRGSSNQRLLNGPESLRQGQPVEWVMERG